MPIAKIQLPDGRIAKFDVPEGTTPEQVMAFANANMGQAAPSDDKGGAGWTIGASMPARFLRGMKDPIDANAQMIAHAVPDSWNRFAGAENIDPELTHDEKTYQAARLARAGGQDPGWDVARGVGNTLMSLIMARALRLPAAGKTTLSRLGTGALGGGVAGAMQPIYGNTPEDSFWGKKALQAGFGSVTGAGFNYGAGKLGDAISRQIAKFKSPSPAAADEVISKALDELGQKIDDIAPDQMKALRAQVEEALSQGKTTDAAALMRQLDFEALGMKGTLGQVTRNATQFAREKNLRGVAGVGEPLMQQFESQDKTLAKVLGGFRGTGEDKTAAGTTIAAALKSADKKMQSQVTAAYKAAEESSGASLDVPLKGLAQDYADVLDRFGTDNIPGAVRKKLDDLGLMSGKQMKTFSLLDADKLLKVINDNYDPLIKPQARALDILRNAVKKAVDESDANGTPFEQAWSQARQRFQLHEAIPVLEAASSKKEINADNLVNQYILSRSASSKQVDALAQLLKASNPEAFDSVRGQIGQKLERAAFGENVAGDKPIAAERLARALSDIGDTKLGAFFEPAEIETLKRAARVGAYMHSTPSSAPVNTSNTAAAVMSLLGKVPGIPSGAALISAAKNAIQNKTAVDKAIAAKIPTTPAELTPEQIKLISKMLMGTSAAGGIAGGDIAQQLMQ